MGIAVRGMNGIICCRETTAWAPAAVILIAFHQAGIGAAFTPAPSEAYALAYHGIAVQGLLLRLSSADPTIHRPHSTLQKMTRTVPVHQTVALQPTCQAERHLSTTHGADKPSTGCLQVHTA